MATFRVKPLNPAIHPGRPLTQGLGFSAPFPYGRMNDVAGRRSAIASTAVTWGLGPLGAAVDFPGSSSTSAESSGAMPGSIFYNHAGELAGLAALSVSAWCLARTGGGGGFGRIITQNDTNIGIWIGGANLWNCAFGGTNPVSSTVATFNVWHHVAMTFDGAAVRFYLDGVFNISQARATPSAASTSPIVIGNRSAGGRGWDGLIDSVHIWPNTVLTPGQIAALAGDPHLPLRAGQRVPIFAFGPASAASPSPSRLALLGVG